MLALIYGSPIGVPAAFCERLLAPAQRGEVSKDWLAAATPPFAALAKPEYGTGTDWDAPPSDATPALPADAFVGTYRNDFSGEAGVASIGGDLVLRLSPKQTEDPLAHYDRDTFSWKPPGENAAIRSGLTFNIGPSGAATIAVTVGRAATAPPSPTLKGSG